MVCGGGGSGERERERERESERDETSRRQSCKLIEEAIVSEEEHKIVKQTKH